MMALQESNDNSRTGHHCRDCGLFFESSKSLEVHLQYHKENLLTKWANQANAAIDSSRTDSENNNVKSRREFQSLVAAPADSTDMKPLISTGPGRPNSNSSYPPTSSPFTHPHTPASYSSAPSPYQNDLHRFSPSNNPGPSPSSTSFGYSNGTSDSYQLPYNNYPPNLRSPRSHPSLDPSQQFFPDNPPDPYIVAPNSDFTSVPTPAPPSAPPTVSASLPAPPSTSAPHRPSSPTSSSSSFRFNLFNKNCFPLDKNGVSSSSPNSFRPQSPLQCEKCGFICDSQSTLADHVKTAHAPSPMAYNHGSNAFQGTDSYFRPDAAKPEVIQDSPDILDLDSQQKVFRGADEDSAQVPPASNPHSVSAMLTPWSNNLKSQYPQAQPYLVSSTNPPQNYPPQNGPVPTPNFQSRNFPSESYAHQSNVPNQSINNNQIPNSASPKLTNPTNSLPHSGMSAAKGDSWKSNEARRPKTYNCSACNKWFTSSGHLKRHYNTTLHKNAVKQSGQPDPATLPISSHHHPNRDPNYIHSSKTPPGIPNPPPNLSAVTKAKKAKSISPQADANTPSPALSNANEGDSSRSNDNLYDRIYDRNGSLPNGSFDRPLHHTFPNQPFDIIQPAQPSAFDRATPHAATGPAPFDQRPPQQPQTHSNPHPQTFERQQTAPFDARTSDFDNRPQNGYTLQDLNRPASNPDIPASQNYDYYRYDRLPLHNQQNSTNQLSAQSPNFQAGPSASPSGGLPICPPLHPSLRTPNHMNTFMGENILIVPPSDLPSHPPDHHTTHPYISSPITTGNEPHPNTTPLPSFSNFQTSIFQQNYSNDSSPFDKPFFSPDPDPDPDHDPDHDPHSHHQNNPHAHHYTFDKTHPPTSPPPSHHHLTEHKPPLYDPYLHQPTPPPLTPTQHPHPHPHPHPHSHPHHNKSHSPTPDPDNDFSTPFRNKNHLHLLNVNINMDLDTFSEPSRSPMQPSPVEFPTSTNLDLPDPPKPPRPRRKPKRKPDDSSNLVSSTGSPQPAAKKTVIKCEECDKYFNRICYLTQHNKSFHSGEKPFKCDRCGKRFHSEIRAKDHSRKHGGEKPYKCDMCPKSFNHKTDLRRHLCLHSGEKPYVCDHCGKGFIRKDHMLKHVDTHKNGKRKFTTKVIDDLFVPKTKLPPD